MSVSWDGFLEGFDRPEPESRAERQRREEDPIFRELDALHDERVERGDSRWFPADGDLAKLIETRRARKLGRR
jgi:hypothetical protein